MAQYCLMLDILYFLLVVFKEKIVLGFFFSNVYLLNLSYDLLSNIFFVSGVLALINFLLLIFLYKKGTSTIIIKDGKAAIR